MALDKSALLELTEALGSVDRGIADPAIDGLDVELQLAEVARSELSELEFKDHIPVQPSVVAEQIEKELTVPNDQRVLLSDDGEAGPELLQQPTQLTEQCRLQVPLPKT